eukprot:7166650-Pyramimonas_sp.AAC.1
MLVANAFFKVPVQENITFTNMGTLPSESFSPDKFSQIDHMLCHSTVLPRIQDCRTDRTIALNSHHFLTKVMVNFAFKKHPATQAQCRTYASSVQDPNIKVSFTRCFTYAWGANRPSSGSHNDMAINVERAFAAASSTLWTKARSS